MTNIRTSLLLATLAFAGARTASAQTVIVVDDQPGHGVAFTTIAGAVTNALNGDIILVKSGNYSGFTASGQSLTIIADTGAIAKINGKITIDNVPAGGFFVLRGFETTNPQYLAMETIVVTNCAGSVLLENIKTVAPTSNGTTTGLIAQNCAAITARACDFNGSPGSKLAGFDLIITSSPGVASENSNLCLYECNIIGGRGSNGFPTFFTGQGLNSGGHLGSPALSLTGGTLFASKTNFLGGNGGNASTLILGGPAAGGDAGDAVKFNSPAQSALLYNDYAAPGSGGIGFQAPNGNPGQAFNGVPIQSVQTGVEFTMSASSPTREQQNVDFVFNAGAPGSAYLLVSQNLMNPLTIGGITAPLLADLATIEVVPLPTQSLAAGQTTMQLTAPALPGLQGLVFVGQSLFIDPAFTTFVLSAPSSLVLLSSAF